MEVVRRRRPSLRPPALPSRWRAAPVTAMTSAGRGSDGRAWACDNGPPNPFHVNTPPPGPRQHIVRSQIPFTERGVLTNADGTATVSQYIHTSFTASGPVPRLGDEDSQQLLGLPLRRQTDMWKHESECFKCSSCDKTDRIVIGRSRSTTTTLSHAAPP